ncbi:MAG: DUF92 domain-containing protein [Nitrososphaerota archaeon]|nr:DUF92 domain-containing protein [Candidatus Geocrenenecus dongiae]
MTYTDITLHIEAIIVLSIISVTSIKFKFVDKSGIISSLLVGYPIYVFGGREYFILLLTFFFISAIMTKIRMRKVKYVYNKEDGVRSWRNVVANGLVVTVTAIGAGLSNNGRTFFTAYLGALSTAFADTLGTEVGLLYKGKPRLIINMKKVNPGTPGAVTLLGYLGGVIGLTILTLLVTLTCNKIRFHAASLIIYCSGLVGMTIDSFLGALVQAKYRCGVCGKITESSFHCESKAEQIQGLKYINTHTVNLIATIIGGIIAVVLTDLFNLLE